MSNTVTLSARWVFPVSQPPLPHGTITIDADRIVAVKPTGQRSADIDLGNAAIIPGLVNAHTHLDLSGLRGELSPSADFTAWLRGVIEARRAQSPEQIQDAIRVGLEESLRFGTTLLGDISAQDLSWDVLVGSAMWTIVFDELIGLTPDRAESARAEAFAWLDHHPATETCWPGLSPHAPYSVRRSLFEEVAQRVRQADIPVAIHLGESREESTLLDRHAGPFVDFLRSLNVWDATGLVAGHDELIELFRDIPRMLWVHANHLPAGSLPGRVYCPRTHAAFGHPRYPLTECLSAGERVALGTDSLASNPDLDVLAEACEVHHRFPELSGDVILRMATLSGAELLGFASRTGSLEPGKSADLVVVRLPEREEEDPYSRLFDPSTPTLGPRRVMWRGEWR